MQYDGLRPIRLVVSYNVMPFENDDVFFHDAKVKSVALSLAYLF